MSKYIDADKLKSIIKVQIKERKEWMKDIDRSNRQDQLWSDLNEEDMSILQIINSLQQEQQEIDLEKEIHSWILNECGPSDFNPYADHCCADDIMATARHFNELGLKTRK